MTRPRTERRSAGRRGGPGTGEVPLQRTPEGRAPANERKARQRTEYLAAARRVLAREGLDGIGVAKVAAEVGLTKTSLYYYFDSKQSLLVAVATEVLSEEAEYLGRTIGHVRGRDVLIALLRALVLRYVERQEDFRAAYLYPPALSLGDRLLESPSFPRTIAVNERVITALRAGRSEPPLAAKPAAELAPSQWVDLIRALAHGIVATTIDKPRPRAAAIEALRIATRWLEPSLGGLR